MHNREETITKQYGGSICLSVDRHCFSLSFIAIGGMVPCSKIETVMWIFSDSCMPLSYMEWFPIIFYGVEC